MKFVRSLTVARSEIIEFLRLWELSEDPRSPFENLILTPLPGLTDQSRVNTVKQYFANKSHIIFDSGGYAVQQGIISYEELYQRLLMYYRTNDWADVYTLPDYVPTSGLSAQEVESRVQATITVAHLFHAEMPSHLRAKAMPVVQGHTRRQIQACVEAYMKLGVQTVGFGSFGTTGISNDINIVTSQSLEQLAFLLDLGAKFGFRVHALGVGSPTILHTLHNMGVYSFDSSCWLRTAGFGNVFMPFVKRRNITGGRLRERAGQQPLTPSEFQMLQQETGHLCFFCSSFEELKKRRFYQILHNLTVMMDTIDSLNSGNYLSNPLLVHAVETSPYTRAIRRVRSGLPT
jgi:queuine/archaeosine tRNA-ribosyltransferase